MHVFELQKSLISSRCAALFNYYATRNHHRVPEMLPSHVKYEVPRAQPHSRLISQDPAAHVPGSRSLTSIINELHSLSWANVALHFVQLS